MEGEICIHNFPQLNYRESQPEIKDTLCALLFSLGLINWKDTSMGMGR